MALTNLFDALCEILHGKTTIERHAQAELQRATAEALPKQDLVTLAPPFLEVMARDAALPICDLIAKLPFQWAPPKTSSDPLYEEHSHFKANVELLGPAGLVASSKVRIGLYGMLPHCEYGLRTHPAEET